MYIYSSAGYDPLERVDLGTEGILRIELKKVSPGGKEGEPPKSILGGLTHIEEREAPGTVLTKKAQGNSERILSPQNPTTGLTPTHQNDELSPFYLAGGHLAVSSCPLSLTVLDTLAISFSAPLKLISSLVLFFPDGAAYG